MNLSVAQRWQVAAIILVGLNLRPVLASVPPLLDALQAATGMTDGAAGLMTALPVFVMGIGALSAAPLRRLLGERLGVLLGLAVIAIAAGARLAADHTGALLATGVAAGLGIAIAQALLPGYIKARLAAASSGVMGLYSTAIMGGAAIASVATPLMARQQSLSLSLAAWALPALVALACWARAAAAPRPSRMPQAPTARTGAAPGCWPFSSAWARAPTRWCWPGCRPTTPRWAGRRSRPAACWAPSRSRKSRPACWCPR